MIYIPVVIFFFSMVIIRLCIYDSFKEEREEMKRQKARRQRRPYP